MVTRGRLLWCIGKHQFIYNISRRPPVNEPYCKSNVYNRCPSIQFSRSDEIPRNCPISLGESCVSRNSMFLALMRNAQWIKLPPFVMRLLRVFVLLDTLMVIWHTVDGGGGRMSSKCAKLRIFHMTYFESSEITAVVVARRKKAGFL